MIWAISVENTTASDTSASHGVPKLNCIMALIMSCITLNWETIFILIGNDLFPQTQTDLHEVLKTPCSNMPSKSFREVSSRTIICLGDAPNMSRIVRRSTWSLYLLKKVPLILGHQISPAFLVVWLLFNSRLQER